MEVDKNGDDLPDYQNRGCAGYRLTFQNDGAPFRYVSNYQVLAVVELRRHPTIERKVFQIVLAYLKLVKAEFAKLVTGGGNIGGSGGATQLLCAAL